MNMLLREGRSFAREFVEVPGGFRRTVENAIEGLIAVLDQLDADPDLEDDGSDEPTLGWPETTIGPDGLVKLAKNTPQADGELEPTCGWTRTEAENRCGWQGVDETEEDDPGEDGGDSEPDLGWSEAGGGAIGAAGYFDEGDDNLTAPETSCGMVRVANDNDERMALRESFDPRLGLRPEAGSWRISDSFAGHLPRFPYDSPDRPRFRANDELPRLLHQMGRIRKRRKAAGKAKRR